MVGKPKMDRRGSGPSVRMLAIPCDVRALLADDRGHHRRGLRGRPRQGWRSSRPSGSAIPTPTSGDPSRSLITGSSPSPTTSGAAYLRYSFTKGTDQEVAFLVDALGLEAGDAGPRRRLWPGRHAHALAERGIEVLGSRHQPAVRRPRHARRHRPVRRSERPTPARWPSTPSSTSPISLCQGAFGLTGGPGAPLDGDGAVLEGMARALRPVAGWRCRRSRPTSSCGTWRTSDTFDADAGVNHERTEVRDEAGEAAEVDLWTTCFTPGAAAPRGRRGPRGRAPLVGHARCLCPRSPDDRPTRAPARVARRP